MCSASPSFLGDIITLAGGCTFARMGCGCAVWREASVCVASRRLCFAGNTSAVRLTPGPLGLAYQARKGPPKLNGHPTYGVIAVVRGVDSALAQI